MAEKKNKLYMEIQMDELKAALIDEEDEDDLDPLEQMVKEAASKKKVNKNNEKNIELAKMYDDAAEYEAELELFEKELEIIKAHELKDLLVMFATEIADKERDFEKELQAILIATWTHRVQTEQTHPQEQLELIKEHTFSNVIEKLYTNFPDVDFDFKEDIKNILTKRWEMLIAIKKEHLEEEIADIYIAGLKPSFVKRIYKQVHGLS